MKFKWTDDKFIARCDFTEPVSIKSMEMGGALFPNKVVHAGYVLTRLGYNANVYGSINPEAPGRVFDNIDDAKAYVEEQALVGITLNKLTR